MFIVKVYTKTSWTDCVTSFFALTGCSPPELVRCFPWPELPFVPSPPKPIWPTCAFQD